MNAAAFYEDGVKVLDRGPGHRVVLVIGVGTADPEQVAAGPPGLPGEVGVLPAVARVAGVEAAHPAPRGTGQRKGQRPEQVDIVPGDDLTVGRVRSGGVRRAQRVEDRAAGAGSQYGALRQVGHRTAQQGIIPGGLRVARQQAVARQAVDVEEDQQLGAGHERGLGTGVARRRERQPPGGRPPAP